ncbi:MAG TPA: hypothetical protein DIT94_03430, partial [Deltaproteobacteria bacterium]|nr:hypothetical protein [Deltaproteobacteria bacterium]
QINEQYFACGVSPTSINLISELKDSEDQSFLSGITPQTPTEEIDIDRSRAEFMKALDKARTQARSIDSNMDPNQVSAEHEAGDSSIEESKKT